MPKKDRKLKRSSVNHIVKISSYSASYRFSAASEAYEGRCDECLSVVILGELRITFSDKIKVPMQVSATIRTPVAAIDSPEIGSIEIKKNGLEIIVWVSPSSVHYALSILNSGQADALELVSSEFHHRRADLDTFYLTTSFNWTTYEQTASNKSGD